MQVENNLLTTLCKKLEKEEDKVETHKRILNKLLLDSDSCCELCQCDCYNSHRDSGFSYSYCNECNEFDISNQQEAHNKKKKCELNAFKNTKKWLKSINTTTNISTKTMPSRKPTTKTTKRKRRHSLTLPRQKPEVKPTTKTTCLATKSTSKLVKNRSNSASSQRALYTRDCEIFKNNSTTLPHIEGKKFYKQKNALPLQKCHTSRKESILPLPFNLCDSMSSLCLQQQQQQLTVRKAFEKISEHDQKIINRMAAKRSKEIAAKENAWLARRFWENERYERELLKYEQMEEFQCAVRDKQFQNYLITKSRLNELAQRDQAELQRLRESLEHKDALLSKRLTSKNLERELKKQEKRCEELRKLESINLQQAEHELVEKMRRNNSCNRLQDRLHRANQQRNEILAAHLKRLRYDNHIAQLTHEENWNEAYKIEEAKKQLLKEEINRKSWRTQQFTKQRNKRNEALAETAKISASLRELVRTSVTPESLTLFK